MRQSKLLSIAGDEWQPQDCVLYLKPCTPVPNRLIHEIQSVLEQKLYGLEKGEDKSYRQLIFALHFALKYRWDHTGKGTFLPDAVILDIATYLEPDSYTLCGVSMMADE